MNHYEFELTAMCPNGSLRDRYDCLISSPRVIQVEMLNAICLELTNQKLFQEDIADTLRNKTREIHGYRCFLAWPRAARIRPVVTF